LTSIDTALDIIRQTISQEQEAGRINGLEALAESQRRRVKIAQYWQTIQAELAPIDRAIKELPAHPDEALIRWARSVLAMRDVAFMEIDTTGLEEQDEITRFTLVSQDEHIIEDVLIKPQARQLSAEASKASGITPEQLEREGVTLWQAWERIEAALRGCYVISYSQEWDIKQLDKTAKRHKLEPVLVIGECLQRHATRYYNREYYLSLAELCARAGYPLPEPPAQTAIDRARGQIHVTTAIAQAITDVRPPRTKAAPAASSPSSDSPGDDFLSDDDSLEGLDDHPF
jgi:hypothetical protein